MIKIKDIGAMQRCDGKYSAYNERKVYIFGVLVYSHKRDA
jgi:hypothetical protein